MAELSLAPLKRASNHPVANLSNLLPTGTVLAVQTFAPSFSNNGLCRLPNKYLIAVLISVCAAFCILSSFTGTFVDSAGKLHYGIARFRGLYIFNLNIECDNDQYGKKDLERFKLRFVDFVHAFVSLLFLIFARGDLDVQGCYFSQVGTEWNSLFMNLSLGAGAFCTFLFTIFPTTRRGIGYTDINAHSACSC